MDKPLVNINASSWNKDTWRAALHRDFVVEQSGDNTKSILNVELANAADGEQALELLMRSVQDMPRDHIGFQLSPGVGIRAIVVQAPQYKTFDLSDINQFDQQSISIDGQNNGLDIYAQAVNNQAASVRLNKQITTVTMSGIDYFSVDRPTVLHLVSYSYPSTQSNRTANANAISVGECELVFFPNGKICTVVGKDQQPICGDIIDGYPGNLCTGTGLTYLPGTSAQPTGIVNIGVGTIPSR